MRHASGARGQLPRKSRLVFNIAESWLLKMPLMLFCRCLSYSLFPGMMMDKVFWFQEKACTRCHCHLYRNTTYHCCIALAYTYGLPPNFCTIAPIIILSIESTKFIDWLPPHIDIERLYFIFDWVSPETEIFSYAYSLAANTAYQHTASTHSFRRLPLAHDTPLHIEWD